MPRAPNLSLALETDVVQDNVPCEVFPNIYIGSIHAAFNQEALINMGITHILNASRLPSTFPKTFTYLSIDIRDKDEANILSTIPAANIFIEAGVASGGVLVHCYGGRSRSAAFVCAFLMSSFGWPYEQAQSMIYAARPVACINQGFEAQLRAYKYSKYDVYVAQQVLLLGRVQALQKYRAIRGTTENELEIKACQRKKFGIKNVLSGGGGGRGEGKGRKKTSSSSEGRSSHSGMKRSWRSAKDVEEKEEHHQYEAHSELTEQEDEELEEEQEEDCEEQLSRAAAAVVGGERESSFSNDVVVGEPVSPSSAPEPSALRRKIPLLDPRSPRCRLSRPGSTSVRIIPPLRGLERVFCCSWCQFALFNLASVIRTDLDLRPLRDLLPTDHVADEKRSGSADGMGRGNGSGEGAKRSSFTTCSESVEGDIRDPNNDVDCKKPQTSLSMAAPAAPPKPVYREPPKTMRNRDAKSFDFAGFGASPQSNSNPSLFSQSQQKGEGSGEMDVDANEDDQTRGGGHASVPMLSIEPRSRSRGSFSSNVSGSTPRRGRGLQIQPALPGNCISPLESPRIPLPPNRPERSSFTYPSPRDKPQSVEKTRWLARVNLLGEGDNRGGRETAGVGGNAGGDHGHKGGGELIDKVSQDDDEAIKLGFGREKYIHIEYLEWMGEDLLSGDIDEGELKCGQCQRTIGAWNWHPHPKHTLYGQLEPPLIRVHKNVVQEVDVPLDSTPANTPRVMEEYEMCGGEFDEGAHSGEGM